jgi:predicted permease
MRRFRAFFFRLAGLFDGRRRNRELADELESHLQLHIEDNLRAGMTPAEASRQALIKLGGVEQSKEIYRDRRGLPAVETLVADLRYAIRTLRKSPGFTAVAILSLTLGIGANTAIFTVINAALLKSLPVKEPERLAILTDPDKRGWGGGWYCYRAYAGLRERNAVFSGLLARSDWGSELFVSIDGGRIEKATGDLVSGNFFAVLGVNPYIGRTFSLEDERPPGNPVAVLSYSYWRERFAADPAAIGRTIQIHSHLFTIIGVTPPGFFGIQVGAEPAIRIPLTTATTLWPPKKDDKGNDNYLDDPSLNKIHTDWLQLFGRLKPGVSFQQAEASLQPLNRQIRQVEAELGNWEGSSENRSGRRKFLERKIAVSSAARGFSWLRQSFSEPLFALMALVGVVLLIACSTMANLLLARGVARGREIAVRLALGAGRLRLVRHMLIESLVLACAGGAFGVLVAWWGASALVAAAPGDTPILHVGPDVRVLGFTLGLSLLTGLLFGLAPVYQALQTQVMDALKAQGGALAGHASQIALRKGLIVLQVALSVLLLAGAGLFVRTLRSLKSMDTGLDLTRVLQMFVAIHPYSPATEDQRRQYYQQLLARIEALPGVRSAATSWVPLLGGFKFSWPITVPGHETLRVSPNAVTSRFFETLNIPLVAGRTWSRQDDYRPVREVVLSESFARDMFGDVSPIGHNLSTWTDRSYAIVGVVKDRKHHYTLREDDSRAAYFSPGEFWDGDREIYVRVTGDPGKLIAAVRREVQSINPEAQVSDIRPLEAQVDQLLSNERLVAGLSTIFGILAALLAAMGLYGVIAFSVARRTREIGLRVALGAGRAQIQWLVMREVLGLIGVGVGLGIPAALAMTRLARSLLFGVEPNDSATLAGAALLMGAIALLAGYLPARRATKVDPMVALRFE